MVRVESESGETVEQVPQGDAGLQAGQVGGEAVVGAVGEGQLEAGVRAADVEAVGVGEDSGVPVGTRQGDGDEVSSRIEAGPRVVSRVA